MPLTQFVAVGSDAGVLPEIQSAFGEEAQVAQQSELQVAEEARCPHTHITGAYGAARLRQLIPSASDAEPPCQLEGVEIQTKARAIPVRTQFNVRALPNVVAVADTHPETSQTASQRPVEGQFEARILILRERILLDVKRG